MHDKPLKDWLSGSDAARLIGCAEWHVPQLARLGHLSVKQLPGVGRARYLRADCQRLAGEIVRPAVRAAASE
jgi:hypothetical protein